MRRQKHKSSCQMWQCSRGKTKEAESYWFFCIGVRLQADTEYVCKRQHRRKQNAHVLHILMNSNNSVTDCYKVKTPMTTDISITDGGNLNQTCVHRRPQKRTDKETVFCSCVTQMFMNSVLISTVTQKRACVCGWVKQRQNKKLLLP